MEFSIMEKETDDILFNTGVLRKFSLFQLKVLDNEIRERIKKRISETEPEKTKEPALNCFECSEQIKHESEIEELIEEFLNKLNVLFSNDSDVVFEQIEILMKEYKGRVK